MVETGDDEPDYAERIAARASVTKEAWQATLDEMRALAEDLESEGWEALAIPAGHTAPENPRSSDRDRFGLTHVVPNDEAETFDRLFEAGAFPEYEVYRNDIEGREFVLTVLSDPRREVAILIAGSYELRNAGGCVSAALDAGKMYTHVQLLDGTHLGSFEHDEPKKFFPHAERIIGLYEGYGTADSDENAAADAGSSETGEGVPGPNPGDALTPDQVRELQTAIATDPDEEKGSIESNEGSNDGGSEGSDDGGSESSDDSSEVPDGGDNDPMTAPDDPTTDGDDSTTGGDDPTTDGDDPTTDGDK